MSLHRSSIQDTVVPPPVTTTHHNDPESEPTTTPPTTTGPADPSAHRRHTRWPMRVVVALSLFVGLAAAAAGVVVSAGGTEPVIDGAGAPRLRRGMGAAAGTVGVLHRPPAAVGRRSRRRDGCGRCGATRLHPEQRHDGRPRLGVAARPAGPAGLDHHPDPPATAAPRRPVDALPGHRGHRPRRGRRQYPHRHAVHRPGIRRVAARAAHRRGRPPAVPVLHRIR